MLGPRGARPFLSGAARRERAVARASAAGAAGRGRAARGAGARRSGPLPVLLVGLCAAALAPACEPVATPSSARDPAREAPATAVAPITLPPGARDRVRHTLRFPAPHTHYAEVESVFPAPLEGSLELSMAVWTPGSYLVREHARHVESLAATTPDARPLASAKVRKNRWRVEPDGSPLVVVRYRVYARDLGVRTSFVDDSLVVLEGAGIYLTPVDAPERPIEVYVEPPRGLRRSVTSLAPHPEGGRHAFVAASYAELVDSPIVLGNPVVTSFDVDGVEHVLASFGATERFDQERATQDLETLARAHAAFWGLIPYPRYVFLNLLAEPGGGLEHASCTLTLSSPLATRRQEDYRRWLGLMSHELFHAWNGKRLRPVELGPFDYEAEVHTRALWFVEGVTSYYDDLLLLRAGLLPQEVYLERLSELIRGVSTRPGRRVEALGDASFDAWIRHYRPNENTSNSGVSYYGKGALVGFVIDAAIREATRGARGLDDAMRLLYARHSGERGFRDEELRAAFDEVAGASLGPLLEDAVDGTGELDLAPALASFGLRFAEAETPALEEAGAWLGAVVEAREGLNVVAEVPRATVAYAAGLNVDDELVAIDGMRVPAGGLAALLERLRPGEEVELLVARRGRLRPLRARLGEAPEERFELEAAADATGARRAQREAWLSPSRAP